MEDQKLLWIVFSVVLFAVVVLASVLYFLKPKNEEPVLATSGQETPSEFDTYEYVRGASPVLPVETAEPKTGAGLEIVVGEELEVGTGGEVAPATSAPSPASTTTAAAAPAASTRPAASTAAPRTSSSTAATPAAATPAAKPASKPASKPATTPAPAAPTRVYWIQTASFKNRSGAETMVATLAESGVTGRVQVGDVGGEPYFRVRVGPYTSRDEADKFLSWIKGVKGLEQSYISVVNRGNE